MEGWTPVILVKLRETPESIESRDISQSVKCGVNAEGSRSDKYPVRARRSNID